MLTNFNEVKRENFVNVDGDFNHNIAESIRLLNLLDTNKADRGETNTALLQINNKIILIQGDISTLSTALAALGFRADAIESIAKGASRAIVFQTISELDTWLLIPENIADLRVGDNFLIVQRDVPDFWWDGTQKQELETQKVDLSNIQPLLVSGTNIKTINGQSMLGSGNLVISGGEVGGGHVILDSDGNEMPQRTYLKMRNNLTVTDDPENNATIIDSMGGGGIPPGDVRDINAFVSSERVHIMWSDPDDTMINGNVVVRFAGTKLVYKAGANPESVNDGILILDSKVRNAHKTVPFSVSGLVNNVAYYFRLFTYSDMGAINNNPESSKLATPETIPIGNVSNISAKAGDAQVTIKWTDPEDIEMHGIKIAQWTSTRLVRNDDYYPKDENDGVVVAESVVRNQFAEVGLVDTDVENYKTYRYMLFPKTTDGVFTVDEANRVPEVIPSGILIPDDWLMWAKLGGLNPNDYGSLASMVMNRSAMLTLMNSTRAVDYMILSTVVIMPAVVSSVVAVKEMGLSSYATDSFVDNLDWVTAIAGSANAITGLDQSNPITIPTMTSNATPSGVASASSFYDSINLPWKAFDKNNATEWFMVGAISNVSYLQYEFPYSVWFYRVIADIKTSTGSVTYVIGKVQASINGSTWVDLTENLQTPNVAFSRQTFTKIVDITGRYKYIRMLVVQPGLLSSSKSFGCAELEIYGK